jgi:hypothetical protein
MCDDSFAENPLDITLATLKDFIDNVTVGLEDTHR